MPRRDVLGADLLREVPQLAELQPVVAHHARIRRAAGEVFVGEVVLDPAERVLKVQSVKWNVESIGDSSRIRSVGRAAASLLVRLCIDNGQRDAESRRAGLLVGRPGPHKQTDDLVPLLLEQDGRCRAVDTAAHRENDSLHRISLILQSCPRRNWQSRRGEVPQKPR